LVDLSLSCGLELVIYGKESVISNRDGIDPSIFFMQANHN